MQYKAAFDDWHCRYGEQNRQAQMGLGGLRYHFSAVRHTYVLLIFKFYFYLDTSVKNGISVKDPVINFIQIHSEKNIPISMFEGCRKQNCYKSAFLYDRY